MRRPGRTTPTFTRWLVLVGLGLAGAFVLSVTVAVVSMGPPQFKASCAAWLDDHHIRGRKTTFLRAARRYETADAAEDARVAVASGDTRLLPVAGFDAEVPGVGGSFRNHYERYGAKDPPCGGCVVSSEEEWLFRAAVHDYAARYNRAVLDRVKR